MEKYLWIAHVEKVDSASRTVQEDKNGDKNTLEMRDGAGWLVGWFGWLDRGREEGSREGEARTRTNIQIFHVTSSPDTIILPPSC